MDGATNSQLPIPNPKRRELISSGLRRRFRKPLRLPFGKQIALVGDFLAWSDPNIEVERLVAREHDLYFVVALLESQSLEGAVEIIDSARVGAIDEDLRIGRTDLQAQFSGRVPVGAVIGAVVVVAGYGRWIEDVRVVIEVEIEQSATVRTVPEGIWIVVVRPRVSSVSIRLVRVVAVIVVLVARVDGVAVAISVVVARAC